MPIRSWTENRGHNDDGVSGVAHDDPTGTRVDSAGKRWVRLRYPESLNSTHAGTVTLEQYRKWESEQGGELPST